MKTTYDRAWKLIEDPNWPARDRGDWPARDRGDWPARDRGDWPARDRGQLCDTCDDLRHAMLHPVPGGATAKMKDK